MGIDVKYGQVRTQYGDIEDDEPVVLFRARDSLLPDLLEIYHILCHIAGSPAFHLDAIGEAAGRVKEWQNWNSDQVRVPTSNAYAKRRETCPACGHARHWPGRCLNAASDNDCDCIEESLDDLDQEDTRS